MTFQYDVEGRLSRAFQTNAPANGGTYAYDAMNRLASRTVTQSVAPLSTTTLYVHDINDHIIAETNAAGVTLREYVWLNDMPIAVVDGVNTASPVLYYVHTDHLGRPARMVAQNWSWVWDVIYSPFGGAAAIFDSTTKLDARFPGQWFQLESGLAYNWHRHYDASLGRYVQPDPLRVDEMEGATVGGVTATVTQPEASLAEKIYWRSVVMPVRMATSDTSAHSSKRVNFPDGPSIYGYGKQSPMTNVDPFGLYGTGSCAFYSESCAKFGGIYECGLAKDMCRLFRDKIPTDNWGDCVRQCLQEKSRTRRPNACQNVGDHLSCFSGCFINEENPYKYNGGGLPDNDIHY